VYFRSKSASEDVVDHSIVSANFDIVSRLRARN